MNIFLQPVVDEMNFLSSEGVQWNKNGDIITSRVIPLCCCVDAPARCSVLNMKQYNGHFGCTFCLHPTENVDGRRKYPLSTTVHATRTHENTTKEMMTVGRSNIKINGVKGPSVLMNLNYFNLIDGITTESMHSVFMGVVKQYMNIITSEPSAPYYIGSPDKLAVIDERLLSIKIPTVLQERQDHLVKEMIGKHQNGDRGYYFIL